VKRKGRPPTRYLILFTFASKSTLRIHLIQQSKSDFDTRSQYERSREGWSPYPPLSRPIFPVWLLSLAHALPSFPRGISVKLISWLNLEVSPLIVHLNATTHLPRSPRNSPSEVRHAVPHTAPASLKKQLLRITWCITEVPAGQFFRILLFFHLLREGRGHAIARGRHGKAYNSLIV
jgi:hypothetical protein